MMGHEEDHISELVAPYVLGALESDEVELVEIHLAECSSCHALVEAERRVVRHLPFLAEPQPVPIRAREQLLSRVRESQSAPADEYVAQEEPASIWRWILPTSRAGWIAAATAACLALVFAVNSFQMQSEVDKRDSELAAMSEQQRNLVEVVRSQRGWTTNLENTNFAPNASGGIIVDPTSNAALLVVDGLTSAPEGHSYVVWMANETEHVNAGVLTVDDSGQGQLYITMQDALASFDRVMVTEEVDSPAVANPRGEPVMATRLDE